MSADIDSAPLFDPQALTTLRDHAGGELVRRMIEQCLESTAQRLAGARRAHAAGDDQEVAREAHSLKSSAGILGARSLQQLAVQLHQAALAADAGAIEALLDTMDAVFRDTIGVLEPLRPGLES